MADEADIASDYQAQHNHDALMMRPQLPADGNGVCYVCDTSIDAQRLKYLPGTRYCRICAGMVERMT